MAYIVLPVTTKSREERQHYPVRDRPQLRQQLERYYHQQYIWTLQVMATIIRITEHE